MHERRSFFSNAFASFDIVFSVVGWMHDSASPVNTAHVHPSVFTSMAEAKSVPSKIKCILQGMQGSKL
jgi:hypothetical protein